MRKNRETKLKGQGGSSILLEGKVESKKNLGGGKMLYSYYGRNQSGVQMRSWGHSKN